MYIRRVLPFFGISFVLQNFVQLRNPQNLSPQHQLVLCLEILLSACWNNSWQKNEPDLSTFFDSRTCQNAEFYLADY